MTNRGERSTVASRLGYIAMIVIAVFVLSTPRAEAAVIDFGTFEDLIFDPAEIYAEDGFEFLVVSGTTWRIINDKGNPPSELIVSANPVRPGDRISITRQGGGLFTFDAFDFAGDPIGSAVVNLFGLVSGVQTEQLLNVFSETTMFVTSDPLFVNPIDELLIVAVGPDFVPLELDNFVLTPTQVPMPEPATLLLVGSALGGLIARRRFRRSAARGES
jgi:hypothetical protein